MIPAYQRFVRDVSRFEDRKPEDPVWWSLDKEPPAIGTRVKITTWGEDYLGEVVGYDTSHGWLMIQVCCDSRPGWHKRENPDRNVCIFAGRELDWEE